MNGHPIRARLLASALIACIFIIALPASAAPASVSFVVDSSLDAKDTLPGDGVCHTAVNTCTLRAAVMEANTAADPVIYLPAGVFNLTILTQPADPNNSGDIDFTTPPAQTNPIISLIGAGASATIIDAAGLQDRAFEIQTMREVHFYGMTIRNGDSINNGGGILNAGALVLDHVILRNNFAVSGGGLAGYSGYIAIFQSAFMDNTALFRGGGAFFETGSIAEIVQSVFAGNHASRGGGIENYSQGMIITNSTLANNQATQSGGGIAQTGDSLNIYNSTISGNLADADGNGSGFGSGIYEAMTSIAIPNLRNSLLAGNSVGGQPVYDECYGTINSYGRNLIGLNGETLGCTVNVLSGSVGRLNSISLLGPVRDNFGPTWTMALLPGSSAIDGGDPTGGCVDQNSIPLSTDQRGFARVSGVRCDIGAYEYGAEKLDFLPFLQR